MTRSIVDSGRFSNDDEYDDIETQYPVKICSERKRMASFFETSLKSRKLIPQPLNIAPRGGASLLVVLIE
jgi:hypothetical protein